MKVTKSELQLFKQLIEELNVAKDFAVKRDYDNILWATSKLTTVTRIIKSMINEAEIIE